MPVYHQLGYNSENLLALPELNSYAGAILSPVNSHPDEVNALIQEMRGCHFTLDILFDSQLYVPKSVRGRLPDWPYFPKDADTADTTSLAWWTAITESLAQESSRLKVNAVCSPAPHDRKNSHDHYSLLVSLGTLLAQKLSGTGIRAIQTALVKASDLATTTEVMEVASILSRTKCQDVYLNFHSDVAPRREFAEASELQGGMLLIKLLQAAGLRVLVVVSQHVVPSQAADGSVAADAAVGPLLIVVTVPIRQRGSSLC